MASIALEQHVFGESGRFPELVSGQIELLGGGFWLWDETKDQTVTV